MKDMKDFKGTKGDFLISESLVYSLQPHTDLNGRKLYHPDGSAILRNRMSVRIQVDEYESEKWREIEAEEIAANARLFANSKKVLGLLIEELENRKSTWDADDPNSQTYKKIQELEQAINDSL